MSGLHILLVEDQPNNVALTRRALKKSGFTHPLVVAEDGQQALDLLGLTVHPRSRGTEPFTPSEVEVPLPALVLLDLDLPVVDGLTVLERVRSDERTRRLPVVILTSSLHQPHLAAGYDLGANSYLRKPVDFLEFVGTIERLCRYWLELNLAPPDSSIRTVR